MRSGKISVHYAQTILYKCNMQYAICNMLYANTVPDFLGAVLGEILAMCTDDTTGLVTSSP